jgi:selenocysteine lyase/cysteine desulfurase
MEALTTTYNVARIREDFPILHQTIHGKPLVYFDNAATTQKPRPVIEAIERVLPGLQRQHSPGHSHPGREGHR